MKVLWLTREDPFEPKRGDQLYSAGLSQALAECGAEVVMLTYPRDDASQYSPRGIRRRYARRSRLHRAWSLMSELSSDAFRLSSSSLAGLIRDEFSSGKVSAVVIDYYAMGWALDRILTQHRNGAQKPVIVYVSHHFEAQVRPSVAEGVTNPFLQPVLRHDAKKVVKLEKRLIDAADIIGAITDEDRSSFQEVAPDKKVIALPPGYHGEISPARPLTKSLSRRVVISGAFDWVAKQSILRRFLKKAEAPFLAAGIELLVVGRIPKRLADDLSNNFHCCRFTGPVEDVRPYLTDARIGLMPDDIGGGFKLKYLTYIFAGLPIATIRSQFTGLPLNPDKDLIARDTMDELITATVDSIDDIALLERMRQRCFDACAHAFAWGNRGRLLYDAIEEATGRCG